jgi:hypothetical protein
MADVAAFIGTGRCMSRLTDKQDTFGIVFKEIETSFSAVFFFKDFLAGSKLELELFEESDMHYPQTTNLAYSVHFIAQCLKNLSKDSTKVGFSFGENDRLVFYEAMNGKLVSRLVCHKVVVVKATTKTKVGKTARRPMDPHVVVTT